MVGEARLSHGSGWRGEVSAEESGAKRQKVSSSKHQAAPTATSASSSFPVNHHEALHVPSCINEILGIIKAEWALRCEGGDDDELEGDDLRKVSRLAWRASEEAQGRVGDNDVVKLSKAFMESVNSQDLLGIPCLSLDAFIRSFTNAFCSRHASFEASLHVSRAREALKVLFGADGGSDQGITERQVAGRYLAAAQCAMMGECSPNPLSLSRGAPAEDDDRPAVQAAEGCLLLLQPSKGKSSPPLPLAPRSLVSCFISLAQMLTLDPRSMRDLLTAEKLLVAGSTVCDWIEQSSCLFLAEEILPQDHMPLEIKALQRSAKEKYAMLLCQLGRDEEARSVLMSIGFTHRLGRCILRYQIKHPVSASRPASASASASEMLEESKSYIRAVDNALPHKMLETMKEAFHPQSPFWRDHGYHLSSPYFSYVHPLPPSHSPYNGLDSIIRHIHSFASALFPAAKEARFAEWWAHCRPHGSGHQLHFDSDNEGIGSVMNPIVSSVLYLTAEGLGGQTLCTDQAFSSIHLATRGWFVTPRIGRIAVFDGSLLHGVVPGRLDDDDDNGNTIATAGVGCAGQEQGEEGGGGAGQGLMDGGRRVTFMVAFWKDIRTQPRSDGLPGASQPFHSSQSSLSAGQKEGKEELVCLPGRECFGISLKPSWDQTWRQAFEGKHDDITASPINTSEMDEVRPLTVETGGVWTRLGGSHDDSSGALPAYHQCFQGF